jgi:hypothetical protein
MDLTLLIDRGPFIGSSIRSVLALVDTQDIKDQLLSNVMSDLYVGNQQILLPYPLPFGEAHCLCCRWNHQFSSSRAVLPSFATFFSTYFTIGDKIAPSDRRYVRLDGHPSEPVRSKVLTIRPGRKSMRCGLQADGDSRLLQYMQFLSPPSRHMDYVQCKPALVIIDVCGH